MIPKTSLAWSAHHIITTQALDTAFFKHLDKKVKAESLDDFLNQEKQGLKDLFNNYYQWLANNKSQRFKPMEYLTDLSGVAAFLRAARLNPKTRFGTEDATGQFVTARSVLIKFSDEPDWGFDNELWGIKGYGYGEIPYGEETGQSSRAPFHILYQNENFIVRLSAPEITEGMPLDRIELFARMARFALKTGHEYWAYRFTAWALHYIQDLTQPYHSKAVPFANTWFYIKFALSGNKAKVKKETTQLVKNRHYLYEDFIEAVLKSSYSKGARPAFHQLKERLKTDPTDLIPVKTNKELVVLVGAFAAKHAAAVDKAIAGAFGFKMTSDPLYDVDSDKKYKKEELIDTIDPLKANRIISQTKTIFEMTGFATRNLVDLVLPKK